MFPHTKSAHKVSIDLSKDQSEKALTHAIKEVLKALPDAKGFLFFHFDKKNQLRMLGKLNGDHMVRLIDILPGVSEDMRQDLLQTIETNE